MIEYTLIRRYKCTKLFSKKLLLFVIMSLSQQDLVCALLHLSENKDVELVRKDVAYKSKMIDIISYGYKFEVNGSMF